jgi:hypothetical protein
MSTVDRVLDIERLMRGCRTASMYENEVHGDGAQQEDVGGSNTGSRKEISSYTNSYFRS